MAQLDFERPLRSFRCEAMWLCEEFSIASQSPYDVGAQFAAEMITIRLHDAWARFCRELVIISAYGNVTTMGGQRLTPSMPSITSRAKVMEALDSTRTRAQRRNEPKWYSARECIEAAQNLRIQNFANVSAALGAVNSPASSLRAVRNFYAHRKKNTAIDAVNAANFTGVHKPQVFHLNSFVTGGTTILESWTQEFIAIATAASQ